MLDRYQILTNIWMNVKLYVKYLTLIQLINLDTWYEKNQFKEKIYYKKY